MCFTLDWLLHILILVVVICAVVAIIKVVLPLVLPNHGTYGTVIMRILSIVLWAVIIICILIFAFDMIACLLSFGGMHVLPSR